MLQEGIHVFDGDSFGRPTGAAGRIDREAIGSYTGPPLNIRMPPQAGPESGYFRAQLVSGRLGMQSGTVLNVVPMRLRALLAIGAIEAQVIAAVEKGETIFYSVSARYESNGWIPKAFTISARGSAGFQLESTIDNQDDWPAIGAIIEAGLGILPNDYKIFCSAAGTGCLGNFFWIFDPFTSNPNLNLRRLRTMDDGLFPFGVTTNGDLLHWRTSGDPDDWKVSVQIPRAQTIADYPVGMSEFLVKALAGILQVPSFPKGIGKLYPPTFRRV
jgi:hypothetical protein